MIKIKKKDIYQDFIDTFGEELQLDIAIEEMSELTKAICKYRRYFQSANSKEREKLLDDIAEEIADVSMMMEILTRIVGTNRVQKYDELKLQRGKARLEKKHDEN